MPDEFAVVRTVADTGGGTQDITHADITDFRGAIIILSGATAEGSSAAHARMTIGFCDDLGNGHSIARRAEDANVSVPETVTWGSNTRVIQIGHPTATSSSAPTLIGTADPVARSVSGVANGIRINWTNTPDAAYHMTVILFGGTTNIAVGQAAVPNVSGLETVGFQPDMVAFGTMHGNFGTLSAATLDYDIGLGFAVDDGAESQVSIVGLWDTFTEPTDSDAYVSNSEAGGEIVSGAINLFTVDSFSATGWNWSTGASTVPVMYFAVEFSDSRVAAVAVETLPGSTGNQGFTGLGIMPDLVLGIASNITAEDALTDGADAAAETIFAFTDTEESSHACHHEEGITIANPPTTNAGSRAENNALWTFQDDGTGGAVATFVSFDANGFTLNFSAALAGRMVVLGIQRDALAPQNVDETEEVAEETGHSAGQQVSATEELSETVHSLVTTLDLTPMDLFTTMSDNALAGSERGRNAFAGSEAADDGEAN